VLSPHGCTSCSSCSPDPDPTQDQYGGSALTEEELQLVEEEFDFEGNLAMFDKKAEMAEIEAEMGNKPDIVRLVHCNKRQVRGDMGTHGPLGTLGTHGHSLTLFPSPRPSSVTTRTCCPGSRRSTGRSPPASRGRESSSPTRFWTAAEPTPPPR
jgi:hypothetical protein